MQAACILIAGDFLAPRQQFIETVSDLNISSEFPVGRMTLDEELLIFLFINPDNRPFYDAWEIYKEKFPQLDHLGTVLLVNSSQYIWAKDLASQLMLQCHTPEEVEQRRFEGSKVVIEWSGLKSARHMLRTMESAKVAHVIAITGQEKPDSMPLAEVRAALQPKEHVPIIPCDASNFASVKAVLLTLLRLHPTDDAMVQKLIPKVETL